jgi:hypothetical protein
VSEAFRLLLAGFLTGALLAEVWALAGEPALPSPCFGFLARAGKTISQTVQVKGEVSNAFKCM